MRLLRIELEAEETALPALVRFYGDELGLRASGSRSSLVFHVGTTVLAFRSVTGRRPFYHFALRAPRNRFEAAREWLTQAAPLLAEEGSDETTFEFPNWNAVACYAHDPCGNIAEVIAHRDLPEVSPAEGPFTAAELLGVCELGLVGSDTRAMASALETLGIRLWDGTVDIAGDIGFAGAPEGTLILAPVGRGWMPTRRPAEVHAAAVVARGRRDAEIAIPGTAYRVRTTVSDGAPARIAATDREEPSTSVAEGATHQA